MSGIWISWCGGKCPVNEDDVVEIKFRDGNLVAGRAGNYSWTHGGPLAKLDIVAFRHKQDKPQPGCLGCEQAVCDTCEPITRDQPAPIHAALDALKDSKPTNPKDALGVRRASMSVLPAGVMLEAALGMMEGAAKYGRHNYRAMGVQASVYYDATMGHLMDWWEGEDIDPDSGLSHVTKAIDSLIVLRDAMLQGRFTDNRPPRSKVFKRDFDAKAGEILDKHADKKLHHYTLHDKLED